MKKLLWISILVLAGVLPLQAQYLGAYYANCAKGGQQPVVQGLAGSGTTPIGTPPTTSNSAGVVASFPTAQVNVYYTGTATLANIFANNLPSPTPLSNPFTANVDSSFVFYAAAYYGPYDVACSVQLLPPPNPPTVVTYPAQLVGDFLGFDQSGNLLPIPGNVTLGGSLTGKGNMVLLSPIPIGPITPLCNSNTCQFPENDGNWYDDNGGALIYRHAVYSYPQPVVVAGPTSVINAGTCVSVLNTPATGIVANNALVVTPMGDPNAAGYTKLTVYAWATTNVVDMEFCNPSASNVTPTALNWKVRPLAD